MVWLELESSEVVTLFNVRASLTTVKDKLSTEYRVAADVYEYRFKADALPSV